MGTLDIIAEGDRRGYRDTFARGLATPTCPRRDRAGVPLPSPGLCGTPGLQAVPGVLRDLHQPLQVGHHPGRVPRARQLRRHPVRITGRGLLAVGRHDLHLRGDHDPVRDRVRSGHRLSAVPEDARPCALPDPLLPPVHHRDGRGRGSVRVDLPSAVRTGEPDLRPLRPRAAALLPGARRHLPDARHLLRAAGPGLGGWAEPRAGHRGYLLRLALPRLPGRDLPRGSWEHSGRVLRGRAPRWREPAPGIHKDHAAAAVAADLLRLHDRDDRRAARLQRGLHTHEWRAARHDAHRDDERLPNVLPAGPDRPRLGDGRSAHADHPCVHPLPIPHPRAPGPIRMNIPNVLPGLATRTVRRPPIPPISSTFLKHAVLILVGAVVAYPFYFMVSTSLKSFFEATTAPPTLFPTE